MDLVEDVGAAPHPADWIDPELLRLPWPPAPVQLLAVLLTMAIGAAVAFYVRGDLAYFFAGREPRVVDAGAMADIPGDTFVRVSGVLERRAEAGQRQFAQLAGTLIFIEGAHDGVDAFETAGRARPVAELGPQYEGFVAFYRDAYGVNFCGESPAPCQDAVLIEAGVAPGDHVWYLVLYALIALVEVGGAWLGVRWVRLHRAAR